MIQPPASDTPKEQLQVWLESLKVTEMGRLLCSIDWSKTSLGPIECWPQSLKTAVSLCLASNFPIALAWGSHHTLIYNDGYWPICGEKHPHSMGQNFTECWASAWNVIGESFDRALAGESSYLENQRIFIDRNGYSEETFFTFSFSPIRDETGGIGGLLHPVVEQTDKMLSERRTRTLRDLTARIADAKTVEEVFTLAAQVFTNYNLDISFALFYELDPDGTHARLTASAGLSPGTPASPSLVDLQTISSLTWPFADAIRSGQGIQVVDPEKTFGSLACEPYPESPKMAFVLPINLPGAEWPVAILVAGMSARLPLTEGYHDFFDLVAAAITAAVANARTYEEERRRAEALAEIDRAKTEFFSNVSHEFRTPLTLMLGPLEEMLNYAELSPVNRECADTAHRNALRLLKMVNSLLDFSRIEAGRTQASYRPTDLATATSELVSNFRSATEKAGLKLTIDCPPLLEPVYIDRDMWEKIVLNLLSNAFKHTFEGEIEVRLCWTGNHAELTIRDTGVGIPSDQLSQLFERFYRVPNARSRTHEGTGIGLSLVKGLVGLHGGTIRVESQVDIGTTFTVSIPSGKAHLPAVRIEAESTLLSTSVEVFSFVEEAIHWLPSGHQPPPESNSTQLPPDVVPWASRQRIVLADDNVDMLGYVQRLLTPHYHVTAVSDGQAALNAIRENPPELVLTDVMMPKLDGFGLLRALRDDPQTRTLPVIMLSARAGEEASIEGLEAGANDYLVKPFSAQELLAKVRSNLEVSRIRHEREETIRELQKMQVIGQLAGGIAHDFNSLLTVINGTLQYLDKTVNDNISRRMLQSALNATNRGGKLTTQLLAFARKQILRPQSIQLNDCVKAVWQLIQEIFSGKAVQCQMELAHDLWPALADPNQIELILLNLVENANDSMPTGGQLRIATRNFSLNVLNGDLEAGEYVVLIITDTGKGMNKEILSRAFEPFFTTKGVGEGTGLGLSQVYGVAKQLGGTARIQSAVDSGTTIEVLLPRYKPVREALPAFKRAGQNINIPGPA